MSEAERKRRLAYKKNRKKWIVAQSIIVFVVALVLVASSLIYYQLNKTYYIDYTEVGDIDYKVYLKDNEFFEEEWLGKDQAYVSSLIENVVADFGYELNMDTSNIDYEYAYRIDAQLEIIDNDSKVALFKPTYTIKEEQTFSQSSNNKLKINEQINIDYNHYNDLANKFIETYDLSDTSSTLIVQMHISVIGNCEEFEQNSTNDYVIALNIPLTNKTLNIEMTSSVPTDENKVLACSNGVNKDIFLTIAMVSAIIEVTLVILLIAFAYVTRNEDINYAIKVRKLVSAYRSYIQQITNGFDTTGYQILIVNTFTEMLSIRDTIQSPILMSENEDQTCTQFIIPTNTKILYMYEIKVDDYDQIYAALPVITDPEEQEPEEPIIVEENVDEEALAEALATPDVELEEIDFVDEVDEEYQGDVEHPGVEVIGVVWPERAHRNKIYRYDPNGEKLEDGDVVLVPTRDAARNRDVIRKAAVAHGNHRVDPETLTHPLKKIIGVVKHKAQQALNAMLSE